MNTSEFSLVPLQKASLCLDCEMITAAQTKCLACGSVALMYLARTLNGAECADPMPAGMATIATGSIRHACGTRAPSSKASSRQRPLAGKCVTIPLNRGQRLTSVARVRPCGWRDSLRQMASVVQRAMGTVVIAGWLSWYSHTGPR
jgi:hypothetical protein